MNPVFATSSDVRRRSGSMWLAGICGFGILTVWIQHRWAVGAFEMALYALAAAWLSRAALLKRPLRLDAALLPLAGMTAIALLQLISGATLSQWETSEAAFNWLGRLAAAFLALALLRGDAAKWFRHALVAFAVPIALVALLQSATGGGRVFWVFESGYQDRVFGPFVYHNKFAQFIELVFPIALFEACVDRRRQWLWWSAAGALTAAMIQTASRSGFAIWSIEAVLVLLLVWRQGFMAGRRLALASCALALLLVAAGALADWPALFDRLLHWDVRKDIRGPVLSSALELAQRHPWLGTGFGTWAIVYPEVASFDNGLRVNQAHNDWLQWAVEGGLPALLLMVVFLVLLLRPALRSVWGIGGVAVLLHGLVDYPMHQLPAFAALVVTVAVLPLSAPGERPGGAGLEGET